MPNTIWCGRSYGFSTDVCVLQGVLDGVAGTVMLVLGVLVAVFGVGDGHDNHFYKCWNLGPGYVISFMILFGFWLTVACALTYLSSRGLPAEKKKRTNVSAVLTLRLLILLMILIDNIIAFFWLFDIDGLVSAKKCNSLGISGILYLLTIFHTVFTTYFISMSLALCCCRRKFSPKLDNTPPLSAFESGGRNGLGNNLTEAFLVVPQEGDADYLAENYEKSCRRMCCILSRVMCCFSGDGGNDEVLERIGRLMAHFSHELDVTTDDMLMGIRLLQMQQRNKERKRIAVKFSSNDINEIANVAPEHNVDTEIGVRDIEFASEEELAKVKLMQTRSRATFYDQTSTSNELPFGQTDDDVATLCEVQHYYKYALGIYGHWLYIYKSWCFLPGAAEIICASNACCCCAKGRSRFETNDKNFCQNMCCDNCIDGNTCFGAQYAGLMKTLQNVPSEDVKYASFFNSYLSSPFALVLDRSKMSLVLTVRGTMSFDDCVKDVIAEAHDLTILAQSEWGFSNDDSDIYCHKGMYDTAMDIIQRLEARGILQAQNEVKETGKNKQAESPFFEARNYALKEGLEDYNFIITGHSLGAGVATILTLLLHKRLPRVRGIVYSPPPCVSSPLVKFTRNLIIAITVGGDFVARLSPQNLARSKNQILALLRSTKVKKYQVFCNMFCDKRRALSDFVDLSALTEDPLMGLASDKEIAMPLKPYYLPGKLIHLALKSRKRPCFQCAPSCLYETCCDPEREYEPRWIVDNTKAMQEILIHSRMTADHFPDTVEKTLSGKYFDVA